MYFTDWTKNSSSFTLRNEIEDALYVIGWFIKCLNYK